MLQKSINNIVVSMLQFKLIFLIFLSRDQETDVMFQPFDKKNSLNNMGGVSRNGKAKKISDYEKILLIKF